MTTEHDDKLSRTYRELPRDEPPRALDAAIVAAARAAPLRRRFQWAGPVSIAAVLVLAVGVTLRMQREEPGIETSAPARQAPTNPPAAPSAPPAEQAQPTPPVAAMPAPGEAPRKPPPAKAPKAAKAQPASPPVKDTAPEPSRTKEEAPVAPSREERAAGETAVPAAPASAPAPAPAPAVRSSATPTRAMVPAQKRARDAQGAIAEPEPELERIAKLREAGRHEEADKALEEFGRRYPGYRIADAMWERVRPR